MTETISILVITSLLSYILLSTYCNILKSKIKDSHSQDSEFQIDESDNRPAMLILLEQMMELENDTDRS